MRTDAIDREFYRNLVATTSPQHAISHLCAAYPAVGTIEIGQSEGRNKGQFYCMLSNLFLMSGPIGDYRTGYGATAKEAITNYADNLFAADAQIIGNRATHYLIHDLGRNHHQYVPFIG